MQADLYLIRFMVNSYFYKLVLSQLVLFHWSTRTFLQLVLWSTRTFSSVNSYFSLVNSYFFFGQLVLFEKNTYDSWNFNFAHCFHHIMKVEK